MKLSIVIPVFNAAKTIGELINKLSEDLSDIQFELILVNDGSSDNTEIICEYAVRKHDFIKFISFRKNFGEHNAVLCGLNHAQGEFAVILDDDFQNPPAEILTLLNEIEKGYDVVYSKYLNKRHSFIRNLFSSVNDAVATFLMNKPRNLYLSSFKIIRKEVVLEIIKYKGPFPYIDGLILRVTDNIASVYVKHNVRLVGESNYTISKLMDLYLNMFVNFSIKPLRIFTISGLFLFLFGLVMGVLSITEKLIYNEPPGWTSTILIIILFSGFQVIFMGVLGEYMGKQYLDQNSTPQWVVKKELVSIKD